MAAKMEEVELKCDDGTSYKLIVDSEEAKKLRNDPACAARYLGALKQLERTTSSKSESATATIVEDTIAESPGRKRIKSESGRHILSGSDPLPWTKKAVQLLIILRSEMDPQFAKPMCKKMVLWEEIARKMNEIGGYVVVGPVCDKKWRNLKITYKRIRDHKNKNNNRISWEYYDLMDDWASKRLESSPQGDSSRSPLNTSMDDSVAMDESVAIDHSDSSSSSEPISDGSSPECEYIREKIGGTETSQTAATKRLRGVKRKHVRRSDDPPKWFVEFMKQRKADHEKRYKLEERRLELEAAQVKAMENLAAAITASLRK